MDNTNIPVLLFAYARPDHLARTLAALKENGVQQIFAFADGVKTPDKEDAVLAVRKLLHTVDWCDISIVEREKNLGLGVSIITGVTELFKKFDTLIVIEDDIVLRPHAYQFLCQALRFYENNDNVFSVSLWSHPRLIPRTKEPVFFCPRFNCWGWGAYRRSWQEMETSASTLLQKCITGGIQVDEYGTLSTWAENESIKNTWATRFAMLHFLKGGINVWPTTAWVDNIGCDGSGTNSGLHSTINLSKPNSSLSTNFPVFSDSNAQSKAFVNFYDGNIIQRNFINPFKIIARKIQRKFI